MRSRNPNPLRKTHNNLDTIPANATLKSSSPLTNTVPGSGTEGGCRVAALAKKCPKCKGRMTKGLIVDSSYLVCYHQRWTSGSLLSGKKRKVDTYACEKCGFMESYLQT